MHLLPVSNVNKDGSKKKQTHSPSVFVTQKNESAVDKAAAFLSKKYSYKQSLVKCAMLLGCDLD